MKRVIIDTNVLLAPSKFKVDIFEEIRKTVHEHVELCIMQGTLGELRKITKSPKASAPDKFHAKIALQMIEKFKITIIESTLSYVDRAILEAADADTIVLTADTELKNRLVERKIPVLSLKKGKFMVLQKDV